MLVTLECPTADVSAHQLGLRIDGPEPDILTSRTYTAEGSSLELGIIGASHVATVSFAGDTFREEISCHALCEGERLPERWAGRRYALRSLIEQPKDFETLARDLLHRVDLDGWLVARFPGVGDFHVTAVDGQFACGRWEWETVHLYPEEGAIVRTWSRYEI